MNCLGPIANETVYTANKCIQRASLHGRDESRRCELVGGDGDCFVHEDTRESNVNMDSDDNAMTGLKYSACVGLWWGCHLIVAALQLGAMNASHPHSNQREACRARSENRPPNSDRQYFYWNPARPRY